MSRIDTHLDRPKIPLLYGGVSQQPPDLRFPSQVQSSDNAEFSVVDGCSKRPGTCLMLDIPSVSDGANARLHAIQRDDTEKYLVLYGDGDPRVFSLSGQEAFVRISSRASTYLGLNSADGDDLRFITVADSTFILNTTVQVGNGLTSEDFTITETYRNYSILTSYNPTYEQYFRTAQDEGGGENAGYFQFVLEDNGFASWIRDDGNIYGWRTRAGQYDNPVAHPMGFTVRLQRQDLSNTSLTYTNSNKRISKSGAFTDYTFDSGDEIEINGGATVTSGYYAINSKIDNDTIELTNALGSDDTINIVGISKNVEVLKSTVSASDDDMYDVAEDFESALRTALGEDEALINWRDDDTNEYGRFEIVSPWRGTGSAILEITSPTSSIGTGGDLSIDGKPFDFSDGTATAGTGSFTGSDRMVDLEDRWDRVAAPGQTSAEIDPDLMPVKMVRESTSPLIFDIDIVNWDPRTAGDDQTNPIPTLWSKNRRIASMAYYHDRLVLGGDECVVFSETGNITNFFLVDPTNIVDSDRLETCLSSDRVTVINDLITYRTALVVFTKAGRQFELDPSPEPLTASSIAFSPSTSYKTLDVRPSVMDSRIYFVTPAGLYAGLREYTFSGERIANVAHDVSGHVPEYIPCDIQRIITNSATGKVIILPTGENTLYVYRSYFDDGDTRQQSAWTKWTFDSTYRISDIASIDDDLYLIIESSDTGEWVFEKLPLNQPAEACCYQTYASPPEDPEIDTQTVFVGYPGEFTVVTTSPSDGASGRYGLEPTKLNTLLTAGDGGWALGSSNILNGGPFGAAPGTTSATVVFHSWIWDTDDGTLPESIASLDKLEIDAQMQVTGSIEDPPDIATTVHNIISPINTTGGDNELEWRYSTNGGSSFSSNNSSRHMNTNLEYTGDGVTDRKTLNQTWDTFSGDNLAGMPFKDSGVLDLDFLREQSSNLWGVEIQIVQTGADPFGITETILDQLKVTLTVTRT